MKAFWDGVKKEGWAGDAPTPSVGGLMSVFSTHLTTDKDEFLECSFAILSQEYMFLSLHLGYHFTTVEALCTPEPNKNYIRIQHKGGGASLDRRTRRVRLIQDLLSKMGFEHAGQGGLPGFLRLLSGPLGCPPDALSARPHHHDHQTARHRLVQRCDCPLVHGRFHQEAGIELRA